MNDRLESSGPSVDAFENDDPSGLEKSMVLQMPLKCGTGFPLLMNLISVVVEPKVT
jgi:hypothetical protein